MRPDRGRTTIARHTTAVRVPPRPYLCSSLGEWSYCSRDCGADIDVDCGDTASELCIGRASYNAFYCRPACGAGCPGACELTRGGGERSCDSELGAEWTSTRSPRRELQPCTSDSQCSEGTCFDAPSCDGRTSECYGRKGFCSASCETDVDCGAAGRCVVVPCVDGATEGCGNVCLPSCEDGECNPVGEAICSSLPAVGGGDAMVCDPRARSGARCFAGGDCASGACSSTYECVDAGGAPNGRACGTPTDCASGNCLSGVCRGTSLRGDPCETTYDCSVGTCVGDICD